MSKGKRRCRGILTVGAAVVGIYYVLAKFFYHIAFFRERKYPSAMAKEKVKQVTQSTERERREAEYANQNREWFRKAGFEEVRIRSFDGLGLRGRYLANPNPRRIVICVHGYRGSCEHDFCGLAQFYYENDCSLVMVDQRSHGLSEGNVISYGVLERYDVLSWARWTADRISSELPIYITGISMGSSSVLMACNLPLPQNVHGIIADCGFTSPRDIIHCTGKRLVPIPVGPILWGMERMIRKRAGFSMDDCSTLETLKNNPYPILFIHGEEDTFVPTRMSRRNFAVCPSPKRLVIIAGAGHGASYVTNQSVYEREVLDFFRDYDGMGNGRYIP